MRGAEAFRYFRRPRRLRFRQSCSVLEAPCAEMAFHYFGDVVEWFCCSVPDVVFAAQSRHRVTAILVVNMKWASFAGG
jgi:hypothetical protein